MSDTFNFINHSVDGNSDLKFDSLDDLDKDWGPFEHSIDGGMITSHGTNKLVPADDFTRDALDDRAKLERQLSKVPFDHFMHGELFGIDKKDLAKVMFDDTDAKHRPGIDSNYGTAFFLDPSKEEDQAVINTFQPNANVLDKLQLPLGSFHLKDSLVVEFDDTVLIIDQRNEAKSVNDMIPRSIEKGQVLFPLEDDGGPFGVRASGDKEIIEILQKDSVDVGIYDSESTHLGGFTNSVDNPVVYLPSVTIHGSSLFVFDKDEGVSKAQEVVKVTPAMTMSAGSTDNSFYFENSDDEVKKASVGDYLMNKDVVSLKEITKDFVFENLENRAPMPF